MDKSRNSSSTNEHSPCSSLSSSEIHHRENQIHHNDHFPASNNNENERAPLCRQDSEISLYAQDPLPLEFIERNDENASNISRSNINTTPWTRKQWQALEEWYVKMDRDCLRATNAYFINESFIAESTTPLWSREYILWRCRCLDTNTKFHNGILPSERKRLKDKLKNIGKQHDHLRHRRNSVEQHRQQQQQRKIQQQQLLQQKQEKKKQQRKKDTSSIDHERNKHSDTVIMTDGST